MSRKAVETSRRSAAPPTCVSPARCVVAPPRTTFISEVKLRRQSQSDSVIIFYLTGQCCYSCRAFFRRSSSRPVSSFRCRSGTLFSHLSLSHKLISRSGKNDCIITSGIKSCIPCRLSKCLQVRKTRIYDHSYI